MMTDHDKQGLRKVAKDMLEWKFNHPVNTPEAGVVYHKTSELLIKISNFIKQKIEEDEQSSIGENNKIPTSTDGGW